MGGNRARPNRRDEGSGALLRVWFLGYLKQGDPISPLSILNRVFFLDRIRFEQRMNFDGVRSAYIVLLSIF